MGFKVLQHRIVVHDTLVTLAKSKNVNVINGSIAMGFPEHTSRLLAGMQCR